MKYFTNQLIINGVNPAVRVALVSDVKHSVLQIYFTGTGANRGALNIEDFTVWYEEDSNGLPFDGFCTDLKQNGTYQWKDDMNETCDTFQTKTVSELKNNAVEGTECYDG